MMVLVLRSIFFCGEDWQEELELTPGNTEILMDSEDEQLEQVDLMVLNG